MNNFNINKKLLVYFKIVISIGLITYLVFLVDWNKAFLILKVSDKFYIAFGAVLWFLGLFFASFRWHLILKDNKVSFSIFKAYKGYFRGMFYNIFLPGVVGGDVIRIGICVFQTDCKLGTATASVLFERLTGVFSLLIFLFLSYIIFSEKFSPILNLALIRTVLVLGLVFIVSVLISILIRDKLNKWIPERKSNKIFIFFSTIARTFSSLNRATLFTVLVLSSLFQSVDIFASFLFSKAIGIDLSLPIFFGLIPLVYFATFFPVSLGGLGVREGTLVFLLSMFGVGTTESITLSFIIYINRVLYGAIGGFVEFTESFKSKKIANGYRLTDKGVS